MTSEAGRRGPAPSVADYVIDGGGSAGCVLAHRLSEDPRNRVVLLEPGPTTALAGELSAKLTQGAFRTR